VTDEVTSETAGPAGEDPVESLRRWETFGGVWEVVSRTGQEAAVSLRRCDGGEEVGRIVSSDPAFLAYLDRV
jgi:hypothetical protein